MLNNVHVTKRTYLHVQDIGQVVLISSTQDKPGSAFKNAGILFQNW